MKRIVICCDGTWNSLDKTEYGQPCITNVVRVKDAVKSVAQDGVRQVVFYDEGVGTKGGLLKRAFDGATGTGLSKNVRDCYRFIVDNYDPGNPVTGEAPDELYFFGFSRGAFTARSLAGFIRNCGILTKSNRNQIDAAFDLYKDRKDDAHPNGPRAVAFRAKNSHPQLPRFKFIGVWDTVGSLGNPLWLSSPLSRRNKFHDTGLSSYVDNAYHALAVDEKRVNFKACLWEQPNPAPPGQTLEQVWFPGVHSDVGGGYVQTFFSDIPLQWMMDKASGCDLDLLPCKATSNFYLILRPHESWKSFYKILPPFYRAIKKGIKTNEVFHISLMKKYYVDHKYKPKNLRGRLKKMSLKLWNKLLQKVADMKLTP